MENGPKKKKRVEKFQENFFSIGAQVMLSWQVERASIVKGELQAKSF